MKDLQTRDGSGPAWGIDIIIVGDMSSYLWSNFPGIQLMKDVKAQILLLTFGFIFLFPRKAKNKSLIFQFEIMYMFDEQVSYTYF